MPTPVFWASNLSLGFQNATPSAYLICTLLAGLSIASWVAMVRKSSLLKRARKANAAFTSELRRSPHPLSLFQSGERFAEAPMYHVYFDGSRELAFYLLGTDEVDGTFTRRLQTASRITPSEMSAVRETMERAASEAALRLESGLGVVASALSGAPVLGLLGTVWGVMESFGGLTQVADGAGLRALAPGLSSAMITTIAGLVVAIPSMFGYNYLVSRIRHQIARIDHFSADFASILDRHFVDHRPPPPSETTSLGEMESLGLHAFSEAPSGLSTSPTLMS
jgi:biopolymer transport protein ExbB/TolQ